MALSALLVFALALMVAAGSPGPGIAALVARVMSNGFRDVLPFLAAMWIGEILWMSFAVAGLAALAKTFATAFLLLKIAGIVYLLFLAVKMWLAPAAVDDGQLPSGQSPLRMFAAGLTVSLGNPKIMVFYVALLPTLVDLSHVGPLAWAELALTMLVVMAAVDLSWALLAVKVANRASATMMAGAAVVMATR
ncbi:LysE family translocator [Burkholderia gladioli]|uniref:LysE family translocator n=1 Tax=Burkholderia gladioli TaxID=28095 RepID=UPI002FDFD4D4